MSSSKKQKFFSGEKKNVLVSGGAGFIGSHLCDNLVQAGDNVICVDNFSSGHIDNIKHLLQKPNFRLLKLDINQPLDLSQFPELESFRLSLYGLQEIYHLACPTFIKKFDQFRLEILYSNIFGTINMLELAKFYQSKLLFASSSVVYGGKSNQVFKEEDSGTVDFIGPHSCYDEGKRISETAVMAYFRQYGLDAKIARIFRTYGPRENLLDGHMIPDFVLQALNNKPLIIYGDKDFSTSLCYVDDIVQGLLKIMESEHRGPFNLGDPRRYVLTELGEKIIDLTSSSSKISFQPPLAFMRTLGVPDVNLAKEKLEWFPVINLEAGLKKMIDYVRANHILLQPLVSQYDQEEKIKDK
jgi:UDP-glucuronate decarboxylase